MTIIDKTTRRVLNQIEADLRAAPDRVDTMSDAEIDAELQAMGIDSDAEYRALQARFGFQEQKPSLIQQQVKNLADGVSLLIRDGREMIGLSLSGIRMLANAYAPAHLDAQAVSTVLDELAHRNQPALVFQQHEDDAVMLGFRWPGQHPEQPPAISVSVDGESRDLTSASWTRWDERGEQTDLLSIKGIPNTGPDDGSGPTQVCYRLDEPESAEATFELQLHSGAPAD